jgi:hypothetical protein
MPTHYASEDTATMSDDDCFDDLLPWQSRQHVHDPIFDSNTNDEFDVNEE